MVALRLELENLDKLPDGGPTSFELKGRRTIEIGRNTFLDWTLPDPDRVVSGKHCEIAWRDGAYVLTDLSTNGTFVNGSEARLTEPRRLRSGDRVAIGRYHIRVFVDDDDIPAAPREAPPADPARPGFGGRHTFSSLWDVPADETAPPAPVVDRSGEAARPVHADMLDWVADIPSVVRPAVPPDAAVASGDPVAAGWPTLGGDATPPSAVAASAAPSPAVSPPAAVPPPPSAAWDALPPSAPDDDVAGSSAAWDAEPPAADAGSSAAWDEESLAADEGGDLAPPPSEPRANRSATSLPFAQPRPDSADPHGSAEIAADAPASELQNAWPQSPSPAVDPPASLQPPAAAPPAPAPTPAAIEPPAAPPELPIATEMPRRPGGDSPFTASAALARRQAAAAAEPAAAEESDAQGDLGRLLTALAGELGVAEARLFAVPPERLGKVLGRFMRRTVEGLHELLRARSAARGFMRSGRGTMVEAIGNNPLKFMPTNAAVEVLLSPANSAYLDADATLDDSFRDLSAHQVAVYVAMQSALTRLLSDIEPAVIEAADEGKGAGLLSGGATARKARLWDLYKTRYSARAAAHDKGMVDVFMMYFGDAYERAARDEDVRRDRAAGQR